MSFPKKGKFFPVRNGHGSAGGDQHAGSFAGEIAAALRRSVGSSGGGIKIVASWTGANEKTVKNWFAGRYGPSGEHLAVLVQRSDGVVDVIRWISDSEVSQLPVHQTLDVGDHGGIAAQQPVLTQDPQIARTRGRNHRNLGKVTAMLICEGVLRFIRGWSRNPKLPFPEN